MIADRVGAAPTLAIEPSPARFAGTYLPAAGLVLFVLLVALLYPGMLNFDTAEMLNQAVLGYCKDWHSPGIVLLWRGLNHLLPGPPSLLVLGLGLFLGGGVWFVRRAFVNPAAGLAALALLCLWPPILNDLALVGKDQAFIACLMLFIALLFHCQERGRLGGTDLALLGALLFASCAVRQDSAVILIPGLVLLYRLPFRKGVNRRGWKMAAALAAGSVVLGFATVCLFNRFVVRAEATFPIQTTLVHDLAGISWQTDHYLMPAYADPGFDMTEVRERYTPRSGDPILFNPGRPSVPLTFDRAQERGLKDLWLRTVLRYPRAYLQHRIATFMSLIDIDDPLDFQLYQPNTDVTMARQYPELAAMNIDDPDNAALSFYRQSVMPVLLPSPVFRGYAYDLAILALLGIALLRRRGRRDRVIAALGAGALLHQAVLLMASPAALFRYLYPSVLMMLAMLVLTLSGPLLRQRSRLTALRPSGNYAA